MSELLSETAWFFFQYEGGLRKMHLKLDEKNWVLFLLFWAVTISTLDPQDSIVSDITMQSLPHLLFWSDEFWIFKG